MASGQEHQFEPRDVLMRVNQWRSSWQSRLFLGFAYILPLWISLFVVFDPNTVQLPSNLVFLPIMGVMVAVLSASAFGARVRLEGETLTVINTFVAYRFPLSAVRDIRSTRASSLTLVLVDGRKLKCWAIQATNLMLMAGKRTRVDKVADELRDLTQGRTGGDATAEITRRWSGLPLHGWVLALGFQVMGIVWLIQH